MKIAIDIDGVLRDSVAEMVRVYNIYFKTEMKVDDVKFYSVEDSFPLIRERLNIPPHEFFFARHNGEQINRYSDCFFGVIDAMKEAQMKGHSLHIISYQPTYKNKLHTLIWLEDTKMPYDSVTFVNKKAKNLPDVDIIVDDNPYYFQEVNTKRCILINRSYNKDVEQYGCVLEGEKVLTKYRLTDIERFDSLVEFLETLPNENEKKLF